MDLSRVQWETLKILEEHKKLIRWPGGFWTYEGAESHYGGIDNYSNKVYYVPSWCCNIGTLRALQRRGLVLLDETNRECIICEEKQ